MTERQCNGYMGTKSQIYWPAAHLVKIEDYSTCNCYDNYDTMPITRTGGTIPHSQQAFSSKSVSFLCYYAVVLCSSNY